MGIIINEFEVVPETAAPPAAPSEGGQEPSTPTDPEEVRRIVLRQADRVARVWAD